MVVPESLGNRSEVENKGRTKPDPIGTDLLDVCSHKSILPTRVSQKDAREISSQWYSLLVAARRESELLNNACEISKQWCSLSVAAA